MTYMDVQHHQEMSSLQTVDSMLVCSNKDNKKPKPPEESLKCPRCESSNTKFCYYNNYSLTQPRYFCKSCRRYWTKGGTLRNVPVGGGCRKNRRSSSSSRIRIQDHHHQPPFINIQGNPLLSAAYDSTDLSLAFARLQNGQLGFDHYQNHDQIFSNMNAAGGHNYNDAYGYLNAAGFLENPYQNVSSSSSSYLYNNISNAETVGDQMGNLPYEDLMNGGHHATTQAVTVTTVKQEGAGGAQAVGGRALWEYPWQLNGGENVDGAMRQSSSCITGINGASANWHGLMNNTTLLQGDVN